MYSYGQIECLTHEQADLVATQIDQLQQYWIPRGTSQYPDVHMYTLGVASYIDCKPYQRYTEGKSIFNPILLNSFDWLYNIVVQKVTENFGQAEIFNTLAVPGFHVMGHKPNATLIPQDKYQCSDKYPCTSIHIDYPQYEHKIWIEQFQSIDWDNPLTLTLPIELPHNGGGLYTWLNQEPLKKHAYSNFTEGTIGALGWDSNTQITLRNIQYKEMHNPFLRLYQLGELSYAFGFPIHQICEGGNLLPDDRRITLQIHALKCDGIWRLFF